MIPCISQGSLSFLAFLYPDFHSFLIQWISFHKILDDECVSKVLCSWRHFEMEILLFANSIWVRPHPEVIEAMRNFGYRHQIPTWEIGIENQSRWEFRFVLSWAWHMLLKDVVILEKLICFLFILLAYRFIRFQLAWNSFSFQFSHSHIALYVCFLFPQSLSKILHEEFS